MSATKYSKRLIEVDLPIRAISAHALREKSRGPISMLHIWWARRPLAACRAVLCATLWPDPADDRCPQSFRTVAAQVLSEFAETVRTDKAVMELCAPHWNRWRTTDAARLHASDPAAWLELRHAMLDFIADFASWESVNNASFLRVARALTLAAHAGLNPGVVGAPLVADPFAGGGAIPLEALRVGADAFSSDLNPVAVLLQRIVLEYIPKYGERLSSAVRTWGRWVEDEAKRDLGKFYPAEKGETPIAYLWARVVRCEGPGCGADIPLLRSLWLAKKGRASVALKVVPDLKKRQIKLDVADGVSTAGPGTVSKGIATCPVCGFATPRDSVRRQLLEKHGGSADARLVAVVTTRAGATGRHFRAPTKRDLDAATAAGSALRALGADPKNQLSPVPSERIPHEKVWKNNPIRVHLYGMATWGSLFAPRQALVLATMSRLIATIPNRIEPGFRSAGQRAA